MKPRQFISIVIAVLGLLYIINACGHFGVTMLSQYWRIPLEPRSFILRLLLIFVPFGLLPGFLVLYFRHSIASFLWPLEEDSDTEQSVLFPALSAPDLVHAAIAFLGFWLLLHGAFNLISAIVFAFFRWVLLSREVAQGNTPLSSVISGILYLLGGFFLAFRNAPLTAWLLRQPPEETRTSI